MVQLVQRNKDQLILFWIALLIDLLPGLNTTFNFIYSFLNKAIWRFHSTVKPLAKNPGSKTVCLATFIQIPLIKDSNVNLSCIVVTDRALWADFLSQADAVTAKLMFVYFLCSVVPSTCIVLSLPNHVVSVLSKPYLQILRPTGSHYPNSVNFFYCSIIQLQVKKFQIFWPFTNLEIEKCYLAKNMKEMTVMMIQAL